MSAITVTVTGMTCGHCVSSVREEVSEIPGVASVEVDLASGKVTIDADRDISRDAIASAVADAGYQLTD
ncbi:MAG: heavy-metal-associated domain-containing protein [Rhodococcus sp.]|nr:heavy-metal-associated domain-containing protein [Rhodococcus sp. (in: high G+C Gram-positive bacteria)]